MANGLVVGVGAASWGVDTEDEIYDKIRSPFIGVRDALPVILSK
jgi:hypothetical protein